MANPTEVVTRMYECFNRADLDTIKQEIFEPDILWNLLAAIHSPVPSMVLTKCWPSSIS